MPYIDPEQHHFDMARMSATNRLHEAHSRRTELADAESQARIDLAAALLILDEVDELVEAGEKIHSLNEQVDVQQATAEYIKALRAITCDQPRG